MKKQIITLLLLIFVDTTIAQEFISVWNTNNTSTGSSSNNQITIPTDPAFTTYNYTVDWGDGNTDTSITGNITHSYATAGTYTIMISGTFPAIYFNGTGDRLKITEILGWGNIQWESMYNAFYGCENLNFDAIDSPNLSQVSSLEQMFRGCTIFNGIVNNWDISTITNIAGMFYNARAFNRPLDMWTTAGITNMSETFYGASNFNEPLDNWNTGAVSNMKGMFAGAGRFNQNINNWNVSNVTNMSSMFANTNSFNNPLNNWNVGSVTDMSAMFDGSGFNLPIGNWDVSNVTNMSGMFRQGKYNHPIESWNVSSVTDMSFMFQRHRTFNQPINNWDVSNVTNMASMFDGWIWGQVFNEPLTNWNVSNVTDMRYMFRDNSTFNQDISGWNVGNVTNMQGMFSQTAAFNQDISAWNVSNVTNMASIFSGAIRFNQPLNNWDVSNVVNASFMFSSAPNFNQPLNLWNVSNATNFQGMFSQATSFDQDISGWDTSLATNMSNMFNAASSFNHNLDSWNISNVSSMDNMLSNSGISQENYDNILIAWSGQTVNFGVNLGASNLQYCDALDQRQSLIDNNGWNITGDSVNCSHVLCTKITMPHANDTATPANSDIRWNPAPNATGYKITLEVERGGARNYVNINGNPANNYDLGNVVGLDFSNEFTAGDVVYVTVVPYNSEGDAIGCQEINFTVVESWANSPDAFKLTYDTTIQHSSYTTPINQLKIQTQSSLTYDYNIDWGDGQYDNNVTGDITHTYLTPGIYTVSIIGRFPAPRHEEFNSDALKLLTIDQWGTQVWESMNGAFAGCENMEYNALDIPNLSNVTNMSRMFIACRNFNGAINNWDVSNVTNMYGMFGVASIFNQPLNNWNVSNVTNMNFMFSGASEFNQNINDWNTGNVTDMARMFRRATAFNQPLNNWDVSSTVNMSQMFSYTDEFNQPLNSWSVQNVQNMEEMFNYAQAFNQDINSWNVGAVTNMHGMFQSAEVFNQPLNSWNVAAVTDMSSMFQNAIAYNQPLNNWDVSSVTNMGSMFSRASAFDQNIDSWNVTNVINMSFMFSYATNFDMPLNSWDVNSVVNMNSMFRSAEAFNQPIQNWNVSAVANMSSMFKSAIAFNQPINTWNVSSVTLMESMFEDAAVFNHPLGNWNTSVVTNFGAMFKNALVFNQPLDNWNTGEALTMAEMFRGATAFNQNINSWNTSYVTTMEAMFHNAVAYNQPMNSWNVASVTTMEAMYKGAISFNSAIGSWNIRGVTTMEEMFSGATVFNQNINSWRVSNVGNMDYMFRDASTYNQPMNLWNLGNVSMRSTFHNATSLNQSLADWDVSGVTDMRNMLDNTALIRENYDNTLIAWSEQTLTPGIILGAQGLPYCDAQEERKSIINNFGWDIQDDIRDCPIPECTQLISPINGDTNVPVNTNITWEHALYAQGYRLTVGTTTGGNDIANNITITNETSYEFPSDFNTGDLVYVTLIPFNDEGDAIGPCTEESFTISNSPATIPECTTLTEPISGVTNVETTSNLSWNAISNADGYRLTVGTSTGANDILDALDVGNVTTHDFTVDLPEDSNIFVTIVPYNEQGDATSCTEENFRTELIPVPPTCTNLTTPLNNAVDVPIDTQLSWTAISNATGYLVIVGTTPGGIEVVNNVDVGNTTYSIPGELQENRTYYATIVPYNNEGDATGCMEESFTTASSTSPPLCTSMTSPRNGATAVDPNTNLTWTALSSATGYKLAIGTTSGGSEIFSGDLGNVLTYDLAANLPENTTIYVTITPYNNDGDAIGCASENFTTNSLPLCTSLTTPANGAVNIATDTGIEWNAIANADGYKLTVIASNSTTNNITNLDVTSGNSYNFTNDFEQGETVTVTIIPFNTVGDAIGCTSESFTIESVPDCTSLNAPVDGSVQTNVSELTWNAIANAKGYKLTVTASNSTINNVTDYDVTGTTYTFPNNFDQRETVTVVVTPYNDVGDAIGCVSESFTIIPIPSCTNLVSPLNNSTEVSVMTDISWSAITNADGYRISVGTTTNGNDIVNHVDVASLTSYTFTEDLPSESTIYVSVVPYNISGDAMGCTEESFETEETIPECTTLINPANGETNVPLESSITWRAVEKVDGYRISLGSTPGGNDLLNNQDVGTETSYWYNNEFPNNTEVFVTILPYNSKGDAMGCETQSFTTLSTENETKYGFSPDGDGINEFWKIDGIENHPNNVVTIYNRWGDMVFQIKGYDNASRVFRGNANKKTKMGANKLPSGTYFFSLGNINEPHNFKKLDGYLVLKR